MKTTDLLALLVGAVGGIVTIFAVGFGVSEKGSPMRAFCRFGLIVSSIVLSIIILLGVGLWWQGRYARAQDTTGKPSPSVAPPLPSPSPSPPRPTPAPNPTPSPVQIQIPPPSPTSEPTPTAAPKRRVWPPPIPHAGRSGRSKGYYYAQLSNATNGSVYFWILNKNQWEIMPLEPGHNHGHGWSWPEDAQIYPCGPTGERFREEPFILRTLLFDHKQLSEDEQLMPPMHVLTLDENGNVRVDSRD